MPIPSTTTRTSHALAIVANGVTVGLIQSWNPQQNRTVTPVYQINADSNEGAGNIYEKVPGNIGGLTINVTKFELYEERFEQAWGVLYNIYKLTDQYEPFDVKEIWRSPNGSLFAQQYVGCWFSSLGRSQSATDSRIIVINSTLEYTKIEPLLGS